MTGWIGDFFRFWWALFYWNARKAWFRLRGAHRDDCPCQNVSDSGLAMDTRCEGVIHWNEPARFRRICPLLTQTPDGWRCSVEAERVRPFWGRAVGYVVTGLLACYLLGTVGAYYALRAAHYDLSYRTVVWPPYWSELHGAQEKLYAGRAQQALARGNYPEALLSLERVCQLNPHNYNAGLVLARLTQVATQSYISDHIYERLMRDVPEQRIPTAQIWFRSLLSRAAYDKIMPLAATMLSEDPAQRGVWLHALLFSARQSRASQFLGRVRQDNPHLPEWCTELLTCEQALLENRTESALLLLTHASRQPPASFLPYYQVERLRLSGHADQANTLLLAYGNHLPADEAVFLRLGIYHAKGWLSLLPSEHDNLFQFPLTLQFASRFGAYLIVHRSPELLARYLDRFNQQGPPLTVETIPVYQANYLAAALVNDTIRAEKIRLQIAQFTSSDARVLHGLVEVLKSGKSDPRLRQILPLASLPTEVLYAILEQQAGAGPK